MVVFALEEVVGSSEVFVGAAEIVVAVADTNIIKLRVS
jgi:hypothetical protein